MKISGSYASLLRGVSQQAPEVRQPGQHEEQVNLLSDPVQGLTRRRGSIKQAICNLPAPTGDVDRANLSTQGYRLHEYVSEDKEYVLLIRETLTDSTYTTGSSAHAPAVVCYNRTDKVFVPLADPDAATAYADTAIGQKGISAVASVGRVIVMGLKGQPVTKTDTQVWDTSGTNRIVVWIRGGAYSRTYSLTFTDGSIISYTTPAPDAGGAAAAISPQNIATKLAEAAPTGVTTIVKGSHVYFSKQMDATFTDGGDGSLMRGVYNITDSVDKLPILAYSGMVVKVQTGPDTGFYVKAITKSTTGLSEARWIECPGVEQATTIDHLYVGAVEAGKLHLARKPADLTISNGPAFVPAVAGESTTNPAPTFLKGKQITYLGVFQDRLVAAAGAAVAVSASGDYFNFFRSTVTTLPLNDPFEMIAQGGEDDLIHYGVNYSRNLVLFGDKRQYVVSGQMALTPTSANMAVMTSYADAAQVPPIAAGGQIYYGRNREGNVGIHQIQPGAYVDSAESFPSSAQISTYIPAPVCQIDVVPGAPSQLLVRSRNRPQEVFVFSYLDQPDGRKQDAWSRWKFSHRLGHLMGLTSTPDGVLLIWFRHNIDAGRRDIVVDLLPMSTFVGDNPYFDSIRPWIDVADDKEEITPTDADWKVAFSKPSERFLIGGDFDEVAGLYDEYPLDTQYLLAGIPFDSYVELTNPFLKDGQGLAMLTGRTVISKLTLNMKESSGVTATVVTGGTAANYTFNARVLGNPLNQIGIIPVVNSIHSVGIGRETREYSITLSALKWYPFALVGVEWTGQSFNRTPRA